MNTTYCPQCGKEITKETETPTNGGTLTHQCAGHKYTFDWNKETQRQKAQRSEQAQTANTLSAMLFNAAIM